MTLYMPQSQFTICGTQKNFRPCEISSSIIQVEGSHVSDWAKSRWQPSCPSCSFILWLSLKLLNRTKSLIEAAPEAAGRVVFKFYQKYFKVFKYLTKQSFWKLNFTSRVVRTYTACFNKQGVIFWSFMTKQLSLYKPLMPCLFDYK